MKAPRLSSVLSATALLLSIFAIIPQFGALTEMISRMWGGPELASVTPTDQTAKTVTSKSVDKKASADPAGASTDLLTAQNERILALEKQLAQFARVIRAAGLDAAGPFLNPAPDGRQPLLAQMGEKYAAQANFEEARKKKSERAVEMRKRDLESYGQESYQRISDLYDKARPQRGNETEAQRTEREAATKSLLTDYPEAWSTSVAVAEQGLDAAMNHNTENAEQYYESLMTTSPYSDVVTEQGIEAIPALQSYLARQYVQEGRYDEAATVIDALSTHSDAVIMEPSEMGQPVTKTAQEIVTELREKLGK